MEKSRKTSQWMLIMYPLFLLMLYGVVMAETTPLWGKLQPGPYSIGFRTVEKFDYSRVFRPKYDYFGTPQTGERTRPVQICIWYPAAESPDATSMVYGEYVFPNPEDADFVSLISYFQQRDIQFLGGLLQNRGLILDIMSEKIGAVRNAEPAEGEFPLIIYHPTLQRGYSENSVLCEYLASHGFVVATTHSIGTTARTPSLDPGDLETMVKDKEFVFAYMRDFPHVDHDKLGLLGYGFGGMTAMLMQMRNSDVEAVVSLEGAFTDSNYISFAEQNPYFDIPRMHVPFLQMCDNTRPTLNLSLFESLKYAPRYSLEFNGLSSMNFTHYSLISTLVIDSTTPPHETIKRGYETICQYTLNFFNARLNKDDASQKFLDDPPVDHGIDPDFASFRFLPGLELPPTQEQFVAIIRERGAAKAGEIYNKFKQSDPGSIVFREATLNAIGYQFIQRNRIDDAIEIFRMNTKAYPNSANCWDSFADGYVAKGDQENAIKCYRKVLELLPNDTAVNDQIREAIRNNAEAAIRAYEENKN
jgi:dienelactone hydrolase